MAPLAAAAMTPSSKCCNTNWSRGIHPKAYHKSERLHLDFWDPRRVASHVLATLSKEDQRREPAVDLIFEMKITGAFLARYTHDVENFLPDGAAAELVRTIAATISKCFWIPRHEPRVSHHRYTLQDIVEDLRRDDDSSSEVLDVLIASSSVAAPAPFFWMSDDEVLSATGVQAQGVLAEPVAAVEVEEEGLPLPDPVDDAHADAAGDEAGSSGGFRVHPSSWAEIPRLVASASLGSSFWDWGSSIVFLGGNPGGMK